MIVIDTHVWLWWADDPGRLSRPALREIEEADSIGVCSISTWELTLLHERGRFTVDMPIAKWVAAMISIDERILDLPVDRAIAVRAAELEGRGFHPDPADRFIFATAEFYNAKLVTRDKAIRDFAPRLTVW